MNPTAALIEPEIEELIRAGDYAELREALRQVPAADTADILADINAADAAVAFRFLPRDVAAEVFTYLQPDKQAELLKQLGEKHALRIVEAMSADDQARLLDELPGNVAQGLLDSLSPEDRKHVQAILGYPDRSIGRLMTSDYVRVRPEWTVARALEHIRRYGRDAETVNVVYVIDDQGVLIDDIRLRQLIMAEPDAIVESLMNRQFTTLRADQPREEAVLALQRYDRVALPVVDTRGVLLGIVTHDDVADVAQAEATEDIQKIGGMQALEEPFMKTGVLGLFKKRAPWLALLFLSELLTSNAIAFYEDEIQRAAILAAFIPAIISSGGNSGSQASTLVIRALGLREIELSDWLRVLWKEFRVALLLGVLIGIIGLVRIAIFGWLGWFRDPDVIDHYAVLALTISSTLLCVVIWGSVMGAMLPFLLKRMGFDPAGSSTPFVATLVDVTGIVIYFTLAMVILRTTLLRPDSPDLQVQTSAVVSVLAIDNFRPGDPELELTVATPEQRAAGKFSRITIPIAGVPEATPPKPGDLIRLFFGSRNATKLESVAPPPPPTPAPAPTPAPKPEPQRGSASVLPKRHTPAGTPIAGTSVQLARSDRRTVSQHTVA